MSKKQSSLCLFCETNPCLCNGPSKSRPQSRPTPRLPDPFKPLPESSSPPVPTEAPIKPRFVIPDEQVVKVVGFANQDIKKGEPVNLSFNLGDTQDRMYSQGFVYFNHEDPNKIIEPVVLTGDEADLHNAIRALEPLLSDADRAKYRDILQPKLHQTLKDRLAAWRERNAR